MWVPHSVTFGDKNTFADWHIVPETRPLVVPPQPKYIYDEIPGSSFSLDLTDSLTGLVNWEDRQGTMNFIVLNDFGPWFERYTQIMQYLGGKKMKMTLQDDPDFYYYGRYSVNSWTSDQHWSKIDIDYRVEPFKYSHEVEEKTFSISNGATVKLRDIEQLTQLTITPDYATTVTFDGRLHIVLANEDYDYIAVWPDANGEVSLVFTGTGNVTIKYRRTRL